MRDVAVLRTTCTPVPLARVPVLQRTRWKRAFARDRLSRPTRLFHTGALCAGQRDHIFVEDDDSDAADSAFTRLLSITDDSYDEDESPHRKKRVEVGKNFDLDYVAEAVKELRGRDLCVIELTEKVDWVKYQVFITGRSTAHIRAMSKTFLAELKARRPKRTWTLDQSDCDYWIILNTGDMLINFWKEDDRLEYDLERVWVLRSDMKNPFAEDFDEDAHTQWVYDEEDGMFEEDDPELDKYKGW